MDHQTEFRTWNVFRRRRDDGLCCAVSADVPVPPFLLSGDWNFGFAIADGDAPVTGFSLAAAEVGAGFNGFYLFLTFAPAGEADRASRGGSAPGGERH
ncbi:hypothetical protein D3273_18465 [Lichenibacterium minor]|uniref:Uncharacterized protein n=1 Tax=Lichenibacterium minor TaxID=2316528 RepID=A0A4Q2U620_9HYPH|nr:hypothetical protein [Lichenibacterium minor]RYC30521.1 hypothetical protein D3273_18465 [Lichenibacterium minor]